MMTENFHLYDEISDFLLSKQINISAKNEWLLGCCSYYSSNDTHKDTQSLKNFVYEQWLLADLREIGERSLPNNLNQFEKILLKDKYVLQVDYVYNVAESYYSQLQKITNSSTIIEAEKCDFTVQEYEKPKAKRVLKLVCSDGVQTVFAMEYKPIMFPCEPFIPGLKILVIGPVECRKGVLFLEAQNIRVLGGETDSLIEENTIENVLIRMLKSKVTTDHSIFFKNLSANVQNNIRHSAELSSTYRSGQLNDNSMSENSKLPINKNGPNELNDSDFSGLFHSSVGTSMKNELDVKLNSKTQLADKTEKVALVGIACPIFSSDYSTKQISSVASSSNNSTSTKNNFDKMNNVKNSEDFQTDNVSKMLVTDANSHFTIVQIKELINEGAYQNRIYTCDAFVEILTSKPRIKSELWHLSAQINDHTDVLQVSFSNSFLENTFGYSAVEVLSQRERMRQNSNVKERIDQILKNGVQKVLALKGRFFLRLLINDSVPEIIDVNQDVIC